MLPSDTQVLVDAEAVAQRACEWIAAAAAVAIRERGVFRLVLAGGGTPQRAYDLLADTLQDWDRWEIFWGDERCLPVEHGERNSRMSLPTVRRFPIPAELGAEAAAVAYAQTIREKLPFDVVMLGMGEDGHTASLFPQDGEKGRGRPPVAPTKSSPVGATGGRPLPLLSLTVAVFDAPKPPPERVSLSVAALQACRQQLVLVTGAGKVEALAQWRSGVRLPIALAVREDACLLVDASAYGQ
ncbi:6-phosphogluconolactonase [Thiothrix subterranea]|uniref:6-phosphogluconolactonase n=1 Tax=Thiothrix subterranea TaxID=2735563 RepID=UPI001AF3020B|nr:6-phosphogluconolactonase [Thiothrix subterranea]QQZ30646.1 6-phosphogluconolactonase [Thiothrix subterranea]